MLRKLEDALRAALEAPFAQLFPDKLHPVEMAAALRRAMDQSRLVAEDCAYAHNSYTLRLSAQDLQRVSQALPALQRELAEHLTEYAALQGLVAGPYLQVIVEASADAAAPAGSMEVASAFGSPAPAQLEVVSGLSGGLQVFAVLGQATLGRSAECGIVLDEPAISRRHAEVLWQYVLYQVRDLDSANGTFVNGRQVLRAPLSEGDLLELGLVQLRFRSR